MYEYIQGCAASLLKLGSHQQAIFSFLFYLDVGMIRGKYGRAECIDIWVYFDSDVSPV
jgi:hypothetical protein